jgi:hypothetical protein
MDLFVARGREGLIHMPIHQLEVESIMGTAKVQVSNICLWGHIYPCSILLGTSR